jgi:hypothetical protein
MKRKIALAMAAVMTFASVLTVPFTATAASTPFVVNALPRTGHRVNGTLFLDAPSANFTSENHWQLGQAAASPNTPGAVTAGLAGRNIMPAANNQAQTMRATYLDIRLDSAILPLGNAAAPGTALTQSFTIELTGAEFTFLRFQSALPAALGGVDRNWNPETHHHFGAPQDAIIRPGTTGRNMIAGVYTTLFHPGNLVTASTDGMVDRDSPQYEDWVAAREQRDAYEAMFGRAEQALRYLRATPAPQRGAVEEALAVAITAANLADTYTALVGARLLLVRLGEEYTTEATEMTGEADSLFTRVGGANAIIHDRIVLNLDEVLPETGIDNADLIAAQLDFLDLEDVIEDIRDFINGLNVPTPVAISIRTALAAIEGSYRAARSLNDTNTNTNAELETIRTHLADIEHYLVTYVRGSAIQALVDHQIGVVKTRIAGLEGELGTGMTPAEALAEARRVFNVYMARAFGTGIEGVTLPTAGTVNALNLVGLTDLIRESGASSDLRYQLYEAVDLTNVTPSSSGTVAERRAYWRAEVTRLAGELVTPPGLERAEPFPINGFPTNGAIADWRLAMWTRDGAAYRADFVYDPTAFVAQVAYTLTVDYITPHRATVTFYVGTGLPAGSVIRIPIVGVSNSAHTAAVTASITGHPNFNTTTPIDLRAGEAAAAATNIRHIQPLVAMENWRIEPNALVIYESAIGTIARNGAFALVAPAGFEFAGTDGVRVPVAANGGPLNARPAVSNAGRTFTTDVATITLGGFATAAVYRVLFGVQGRSLNDTLGINQNTGSHNDNVPVVDFRNIGDFLGRIADRTRLMIFLENVTPGNTPGTIVIEGLTLVPTVETLRDLDSIDFSQNHSIRMYGVATANAVTRERTGFTNASVQILAAADVIGTGMAASRVAGIQTANPGIVSQAANGAAIILQELTPNSWNPLSMLRFTLTDAEGNPLTGEVKITEVRVDEENNDLARNNPRGQSSFRRSGNANSDTSVGAVYQNKLHALPRWQAGEPTNFRFSENGDSIEFWGMTRDSAMPTSYLLHHVFRFAISTSPDFHGEVWVEIGGAAAQPLPTGTRIQIAYVRPRIDVQTEVNETRLVGVQTVNVSDITITERVNYGLAAQGETFDLNIVEFNRRADAITFNPISLHNIQNGPGINIAPIVTSGASLQFRVASRQTSPQIATSVTFTGLAVRIDRNVPFGSFGLSITGTRIQNNYSAINAMTVGTHSLIPGSIMGIWGRSGQNGIATGLTAGYLPGHGTEDNRWLDGFPVFGLIFDNFISTEGVAPAPDPTRTRIEFSWANGTENMNVDGAYVRLQNVHGATTPIINRYDRAFLPMRPFAEALGADRYTDFSYGYWVLINDAFVAAVSVRLGYRTIEFAIDLPFFRVNEGSWMTVDPGTRASIIENGTTYVAVRAFEMAFGLTIQRNYAAGRAILNPTDADRG